jgi:hypothetical protein
MLGKREQRLIEDIVRLKALEAEWLRCSMLGNVDPDGESRVYYRRLAVTADDLILKHEAQMVRRHLL